MTNITFAEHLAQLSAEELSAILVDADASLNPAPFELRALVWQERIRRHAETCQDLDCGFNPYS